MGTLGVGPHAALVDVPAPGVGGPGREPLVAGAGEGSHCVGTVGVPPAVVWKVAVRALVDVYTALVGRVISVASVTVTPPAPHRVDTGGVLPAVGGGVGRVGPTLVNIATTYRVQLLVKGSLTNSQENQ